LILLIAALILEFWLAGLLLHGRIHRVFPLFFAYTAYSALASAAQILVFFHYRTYFIVYWATEAVLVILGVLAVLEVFRWIFILFWLRWPFRLFVYTAIALVMLLAIMNARLNPPSRVHPLVALTLSVGITVNFIQASIFALFWLLARSLQIGFRRYAFGIMLGFGVSSIGTLIAWITRSVFGTKFNTLGIYLPPVAYIFALAFWLHVFLREEPPEAEWSLPLKPEELAEQLRQYTKILKKL
jgi:hypothetical protein